MHLFSYVRDVDNSRLSIFVRIENFKYDFGNKYQMILSELKLFPSKHDAKFSEVIGELVKKHGTQFFQGGQATVIDRGTHVWRTWFNDPGYERFLTYLDSNKKNQYLPRILSKVREEHVQFKGMPKGMSIKYVKLEKLVEAPISIFTDAIDTVYFSSNSVKLPATINELAELSLTLKVPSDSEASNSDIKEVILKHSEFFKVLIDLVRNHKANDITSGNVMFRGSTPVIIDPFKD